MAARATIGRAARALVRLLAIVALGLALIGGAAPASADSGAWPKYLHDNGGSGFSLDGGITATTAPNLKPVGGWPLALGATISAQPVLANNLLYVGAWDGNEYAITPSGGIKWKRFLGITTKGKACQYPIGIAGTPVVATMTTGGSTRSVLYVGGGGNADAAGHTISGGTAQLFALDALTGEVVWHTPLASSPANFIWSSPALYRGSRYFRVSAFSDSPLIQCPLCPLDASTAQVQHTANMVPDGSACRST